MSNTPSIGFDKVQVHNMPTSLAGLTLESMFLVVGSQRSNALTNVSEAYVADMAERNKEIQELNKALQFLRANKNHVQGNAGGTLTSTSYADSALTRETNNTLVKHGVKMPTTIAYRVVSPTQIGFQGADKAKFEQGIKDLIDNIKTAIDSKSTSSQLDMIKMQGLLNKRNQSFEMLSNILNSFKTPWQTIIGNLR
ncbi:MAG: hypothetical protein AAF483_22310 [Planctomycetota bacterium]